jgi:ankyrin repeat protein
MAADREQDGNTALHYASYCGDTSVADKLIGAGANINSQDKVCRYKHMHYNMFCLCYFI